MKKLPEQMRQRCIYLPESLLKLLREKADAQERSVSWLVREILAKWESNQ